MSIEKPADYAEYEALRELSAQGLRRRLAHLRRYRVPAAELEAAYAEAAADPEYVAEVQREVAVWDCTLMDGL